MSMRRFAAAVLAAVALWPGSTARAGGDPFVYTVTTTSGTPETVRVTGHSLIRATDAVILGFGRAAPLADRDVSAVLTYAGVHNALTLDLSADRTTASLRYNLTRGPTDTFSAANVPPYATAAQVIDDQVYDDLTDPHHQQIENLQQALNRQSYIMPLDGNPSAASAFLADQTFAKFGLVRVGQPPGYLDPPERPVRFDAYGMPYSEPQPVGQLFQPVFWFDVQGLSERTNGFDGYDIRYSFNALGHFAPGIGWSLSVPVQYRDIAGAESDTVAINFGLPIDIFTPRARQPFGWTVTPFFEFGVNESRDLGSTQGIFDAGLASRFTFSFGRRREWTVAVGDQFTGFVGLGPVRDDDGGFDDDGGYAPFRGHLAQQLVKNGVQLVRSFDYGLSADVSVTYSGFIANAATDQWWTPHLGVAWQPTPNLALRLAYRADLANRYTAQGGEFSVDFKY